MDKINIGGDRGCPSCGALLDGVTTMRSGARPKSGDLSICAYCSTWLIFSDDMTLGLLTSEARAALPEYVRADMRRAERVHRRMALYHPRKERAS